MTAPAASTERIFYDGDCGVCHWAVAFVARHDGGGRAFRFAPLGGEVFRRSVPQANRDLPDSLVVRSGDGELLLRSEGLVHILSRLGPIWRFLGAILALVPRPVRDYFYDRFAERRHRLARRPEGICPMVPPEPRQRFDP